MTQPAVKLYQQLQASHAAQTQKGYFSTFRRKGNHNYRLCPSAATWGVTLSTCPIHVAIQAAILCANMMSSIIPEVHNISQCWQRRTEPWS